VRSPKVRFFPRYQLDSETHLEERGRECHDWWEGEARAPSDIYGLQKSPFSTQAFDKQISFNAPTNASHNAQQLFAAHRQVRSTSQVSTLPQPVSSKAHSF